MDSKKKYYKLKLCNFYDKHGNCTKGNNCNYAHGENELRPYKKKCVNGLNCFKKYCQFIHPEDWDYKKNVRICEFFKNGYCINEDNCDFKHIKEDIKEDIEINIDEEDIKEDEKDDKTIDVNNNDEFPSLRENIKTNDDILEYKNLAESNGNNDIHDNINIEVFVNGVEYDDKNNMLNINENINNKENCFSEIENHINKLQNDFLKFTNKIKKDIDEKFINDKYIYGINMKLGLNKIISEIDLFKNNFQDIKNLN
jgi:hypothetical protein